MHGPGGPGGFGGPHGGPRGGFGGPRGGFGGPYGGYGPHGHYGHGPHGPYGYGHYGYHRPHFGYYGRRRRKGPIVGTPAQGGSLWQEFKGTMSYSLKKHSVFGLATGLASFVLINPIHDMAYTYRKNALEYSMKKKRITDEQYNLRMIKLEEGNCAHLYRNGIIDAEEYDRMMDSFENKYSISEAHKIK